MSSYKFQVVLRRSKLSILILLSLLFLSSCGGSESDTQEKPVFADSNSKVDVIVENSTNEPVSETVEGESDSTIVDPEVTTPQIIVESSSGSPEPEVVEPEVVEPEVVEPEVTEPEIVSTEPVLKSISISPYTDSLAKGTRLNFTVTGFYSDNSNEDISSQVNWSSQTPGLATVDETGYVDAIATGMVTISVAINGLTVNRQLTVTPATLDSLEIIPVQIEIAAGTQQDYTAMGIFSDGSVQNITNQVDWVSSDVNVASFSTSQITSFSVGNSVISASLEDVESHAALQVNAAILERIEINAFNSTLAKGTQEPLTVSGFFSDNSFQDITHQVSWYVDNEAIIQINSSDALVSAVNVGSSELTVSLSGVSASATLEVTDAILSSIEIQPTNPAIAAGYQQVFSATGIFSDQSTQDFTQLVSWYSSNPESAGIDNRKNFKGIATSFKPGIAEVSAKYQQLSVSTQFNVNDATLLNIEVEPAGLNLVHGLQQQFTATAYYSNGSQQLVTDQVQWLSSNKQVSYVTGEKPGLFKANVEGDTKIIASLDNISSFSAMTVTKVTLDSMTMSLISSQMPAGTNQLLEVTGFYSDGSSVDISRQVLWQVSKPEVAIVDRQNENILLKTAKAGYVDISAHLGGRSVTESIDVSSAILQQIQLTSESDFLYINQQMQIQAEGLYSDGSIQNLTSDVSWFSDDQSIASISNSKSNRGELNALAEGVSSLTASFEGSISDKIIFTILDDPGIPAEIGIQASPNVIFNNGVDSTLVSVTVKPLQQHGVIADGTVINFVITENEEARVETAVTIDGVASVEINSVFEGVMTVKAEMEAYDLTATTRILSTSSFNFVLQVIPLYQAVSSDGVYQKGSMFGLVMRNLSNRDFDLLAFQAKNGDEHLPDSPVTNPDLLSDGTLSGGEYTGLVYKLDSNITDNGITAGYILGDQSLQQLFGFMIGFTAQ